MFKNRGNIKKELCVCNVAKGEQKCTDYLDLVILVVDYISRYKSDSI